MEAKNGKKNYTRVLQQATPNNFAYCRLLVASSFGCCFCKTELFRPSTFLCLSELVREWVGSFFRGLMEFCCSRVLTGCAELLATERTQNVFDVSPSVAFLKSTAETRQRAATQFSLVETGHFLSWPSRSSPTHSSIGSLRSGSSSREIDIGSHLRT